MLTIRKAVDNKPIDLHNIYNNRACYLIAGGPSINPTVFKNNYGVDIDELNNPNIFKITINNAAKIIRPQLTIQGDSIDKFIASQYLDSTIMNFVSNGKRDSHIYNSQDNTLLDVRIKDCPNTYIYELATGFDSNTWLNSKKVIWGNEANTYDKDDGQNKGARSTFLAAIRLLYHLGFRSIFLIGADFTMSKDYKYAFAQDRNPGSISNNNHIYKCLNNRFDKLQKTFLDNKFYIYNCNKQSHLKSFPFLSLSDALKSSQAEMANIDIKTEPTENMYDKAKSTRNRQSLIYHMPLVNYNETIVSSKSDVSIIKDNATMNLKSNNIGYNYYHFGTKCQYELLLSIYSLRKHTDLPIQVLNIPPVPSIIDKYSSILNYTVTHIDKCPHSHHLADKCFINKNTQFDRFIFLDADTIVSKSIDHLFDELNDKHFAVTHFSDHTTSSDLIQKRFKPMLKLFPQLVETYDKSLPMSNTGVYYAHKHSPIFNIWQDISNKVNSDFNLMNDASVRLLYDELIMNCMLPYYNDIHILPNIYNASNISGCIDNSQIYVNHYHSKRGKDLTTMKNRYNIYNEFTNKYNEVIHMDLFGGLNKTLFM